MTLILNGNIAVFYLQMHLHLLSSLLTRVTAPDEFLLLIQKVALSS